MLSRRARVYQKRMGRRAWLLLGSSIVLFLVFIFGLNRVADIADLVRSFSKAPPAASPDDKTPPGPPNLSEPLPKATKTNKLRIAGVAEVDSKVKVFLNGEAVKQTAVVGQDSRFSTEIALPGEEIYYIWLTATDPSGNESDKTPTSTVAFDTKPPEIEIKKPVDSESVFGKETQTIEIEGIVNEPKAKITVNERLAQISDDGSFTLRYTLSEGNNTLLIVATDLAENKTEKTITVQYTP